MDDGDTRCLARGVHGKKYTNFERGMQLSTFPNCIPLCILSYIFTMSILLIFLLFVVVFMLFVSAVLMVIGPVLLLQPYRRTIDYYRHVTRFSTLPTCNSRMRS